MTRFVVPLMVVLALSVCAPAASAADFEYVKGQETAAPDDAVCPGIGLLSEAGYYRNEAGREPRANETFYLVINLTYFESFECAATFTGIHMTLPAGLALDTGDTTRVACRRFNLATGASDPRTTANCPASPPLIGGSTYDLDPIASNPPEGTAFGRRYWFQGYDGANTYRVFRVLVPVRASGALNAAPVVFQMKRFDSPTPWTATASVTTSGAPQPPNGGGAFVAPRLSVQNAAGDFQVSPIGSQIPFAVTKGSAPYGYSEKVVLGTNPLAPAYSPGENPGCAEASLNEPYWFTTDETFLDVYGDFGDVFGFPHCDLRPGLQFSVDLCIAYRDASNALTGQCELTTFTTPRVDVGLEVSESDTTSGAATFTPVLRGAWPPGVAKVKLTRPGQAPQVISTQSVAARGTGTTPLAGSVRTDLASWQEHKLQTCFDPTDPASPTATNPVVPELCGPETTFVPGRLESAAATATATTATVTAIKLRSPNPALTVQLRAALATGATNQDSGTLPVVASAPVAASAAAGTVTAPDLVATGLAPATRYVYVVCVQTDADAAPEDCTAARSVTTGAAPAAEATPVPTPVTTPAATATPGGVLKDLIKPTVKLRVKGKVRRGGTVTLTVTATDAGGIAKVTIKVAKKKAVVTRKLKVRLPRKRGKVKVVVTVTDRAGNRTVVTRRLVVR